jgi:exonuclease SbcC
MILNGHYHPGYPVHEENGTIFGNPGSSGRDEICKRMPQYAVVTATKTNLKVKYVQYKCAAPYADIFDFTAKQSVKQHERYLEAFENTVQDAMNFDAYNPQDALVELTKTNTIEASVIKMVEDAISAAEQQYHDSKLDGYVEKKFPIAIDEIELTNFESHAHTVVKLSHTGMNAITGVTDSGKSGVIRCLRWVLYNEPKGSAFIRMGESRTTGTVRFSDGSSITRSRTHSDAGSYIVRDASGAEREFKGFGNAIPIDVANVHQMPKVELAPGIERSLSFAYQLDAHFLLSESGGVRAAAIGRLTGVHIIDAAIKEKKREILGLTKVVNQSEERIKNIDDKLSTFDDIQELKGQLDLSSILLTQIENLETEIIELTDYLEELSQLTGTIKKITASLDDYVDVPKAEKKLLRAETLVSELRDIQQLNDDLIDSEAVIEELTDDLAHYGLIGVAEKKIEKAEVLVADIRELQTLDKEYFDIDEEVKDLCASLVSYGRIDKAQTLLQDIESTAQELKELRELQILLRMADDDIVILESNIIHQTELVETANRKIKNVFASMGNKCPTCQQDLDEEHMEHVVDAV